MPPPVEVVVLYAPEDAEHQAALVKHLAGLEKRRVLATWSAHKIGAGQDWRRVTDEHLQAARVVLLLLTADFIASDVLDLAEKADRAGARLVPIRVRPYFWPTVPFSNLAPLPKDVVGLNKPRKFEQPVHPVTGWAGRSCAPTSSWASACLPRRTAAAERLAPWLRGACSSRPRSRSRRRDGSPDR